MKKYEKSGYLNSDFKIFHLSDNGLKDFNYHFHSFKKIVLFIKGNVTYCIEGKYYSLKPYDIVLVNSGEVHKPIIHDSSTYERIIIYISPNFINAYKEEDYDLSFCFDKAQMEQSNVLRIDSLRKSKLYKVSLELEQSFHDVEYAKDLYRKILFLEFMIQLNRAAIHNRISYIDRNYSNEKIIHVLDYMNTHITEELTVDTIAESVFVSKYYLMHLFRKETGYTIGNYITNKRLLLARDLIQSGTPITTACYDCGFKNYSTFSRAYKKWYQKVPSDNLTVSKDLHVEIMRFCERSEQ